ncbi:hypothetical protein [Pseudobacteroides cellulosolvens]|uniref:Uncharacterized protein n=1 Tax=Pseudobacteroides cellulosolvens ATCC 35603 = DSM 2933 TaxID=398512 RepID=A0A0L6JGM4_9FIRM|nr:hypothetical protein [Pseudobacteroides cellulosolvens]KNY24859.1 hypothetical protein Bccel_0116 [Pseudobacteroides cellulosolvens ATCC 35603 = DSM 2933]
MRYGLLVIISLGVLYFIFGFILVKIGWLDANTYNSFSTIVGGVATLCGLFTFALPKLTPKDIEKLEIDSFRRMSKVGEELISKNKEIDLKTTPKEIKTLRIPM